LDEQGLIRNQVLFPLVVKYLGIEKKIQVGSFRLTASMSAIQIANKLTQGTDDVWITTLEGWRAEQILDYLESVNPNWQPTLEEKLQWKGNEGKLFPDTYLVPKEATLSLIRDLMLANFESKITPEMKSQAERQKLSIDDVLIIASMVEREARRDVDRPVVAGIILNRLNENMMLNIDATIQYAIGYTQKDGWWRKELTQDDLKFQSLYNTYLHSGLPPAPISNPGIASIKAVIYPTKTNYLYYITDLSGNMHYAKTLGEHNKNVNLYLR
jgi:UPF0755 protein